MYFYYLSTNHTNDKEWPDGELMMYTNNNGMLLGNGMQLLVNVENYLKI